MKPVKIGSTNRDTQKERRTARLKPPSAPNDTCAIYRSDGASRQNGWGNMSVAGVGAAYWAPGSRRLGAPLEKARRYLGTGVSNNIAEYSGLLECMKRAARKGERTLYLKWIPCSSRSKLDTNGHAAARHFCLFISTIGSRCEWEEAS